MFSYRLIIKQALNLAWRYKYLWIFGLFASIVAAGGSFEYQLLSGGLSGGVTQNSYHYLNIMLNGLESLGVFLTGLMNLFTYDILTIINTLTALLIVLALVIFFIWISVSSQGALVEASKNILSSRKKIVELNLKDLISTGHKNFWQILGLNILFKAAVLIMLSIISLPLLVLAVKYSVSLTFIYTLAFVILVPLSIALSLILKYAIAYKVLEDESFENSIIQAWHMFKKNWLVSIEMGIILFFITFIIGFLLLIAMSIIVLPYFIFAINYSILWLIIVLALVALLLILSVGSFLTTFQMAAWTDIYLELKKGNGQAKLERIFKK